MADTKTSGNPSITHGDDDEWIAGTITRIDAAIAGVDTRLEHLDEYIHRIDQALQPLRDHPEAISRGLSMLDPGKGVRAFLGKKEKKDHG
jgi:hypothetical protein